MAARRYEISLRVLKNISRVSAANERNILFNTNVVMYNHWRLLNCHIDFVITKMMLTAEDRRSCNCNLSNCKLTRKNISGLQRDSNPWPLHTLGAG